MLITSRKGPEQEYGIKVAASLLVRMHIVGGWKIPGSTPNEHKSLNVEKVRRRIAMMVQRKKMLPTGTKVTMGNLSLEDYVTGVWICRMRRPLKVEKEVYSDYYNYGIPSDK
jgi:hypothetical protein